MRVNNLILSLINELTATHLTPGVQPSEIADAIFEDNYKSIESENKNGGIQMSVTFQDKDEEGVTLVVMRYTYNADKVLMRVEQKVGKRQFKIQWDRESAVDSLLTKISCQLEKLNNQSEIQKVMESIPSELWLGIRKRLALVV